MISLLLSGIVRSFRWTVALSALAFNLLMFGMFAVTRFHAWWALVVGVAVTCLVAVAALWFREHHRLASSEVGY